MTDYPLVTPAMLAAARAMGPDFDDRVFAAIYRAMFLASCDSRRMAETGTGSVRSTTGAVPEGETPND